MKQRGRKSAEAATTEGQTLVIDPSRRMPAGPPSELTDAQAAVWRDVAASMRGDWLSRGAYPVLVNYCRHVCRARLLESMVAGFQAEWIKAQGGVERLNKLLAMAERETRAAVACARSLRLTPQAQMHPRTAGRSAAGAPRGPRPWDHGERT